MVARSEDKPRTVTDRIDAASRRLDELARAQSNGSPSLYNEAGHLLTLDAQSGTPFLVPRDTDSGLRFNDGLLEVTDPTGTQYRDIRARRFRSDDVSFSVRGDTAYVAGPAGVGWRTLQAGTTYVHGQLYLDGTVYGRHVGSVASDGQTSTIEGGVFQGNTASFTNSVGATTLVYGGRVEDAQGNVRVPASDRAMKRNVEPLPSPALDAFARVDWPSWEYLPRPADDGPWTTQDPVRHVGAMAQDMQADPVLSLAVRDVDGALGVETSDLLGIAGQALREAHDRIAELEAKLNRITGVVEKLTGKLR